MHGRNDEIRATKVSVTRKYCSDASLECAIQHHRAEVHTRQQKLESTQTLLLRESWHRSFANKPYVEAIVNLFEPGNMSDFDVEELESKEIKWTVLSR